MNPLLEMGYYLGIGFVLIFFLYVVFRVIFYSFFKTKSQFNNQNDPSDNSNKNNNSKGN